VLVFLEAGGYGRLCLEWQSGAARALEPSVVQCVPFGCRVGDFLLEFGRRKAAEGVEVVVVSNVADIVMECRAASPGLSHLGFMFVEGEILLPGLTSSQRGGGDRANLEAVPASAGMGADIDMEAEAPPSLREISGQRSLPRRDSGPPLRRAISKSRGGLALARREPPPGASSSHSGALGSSNGGPAPPPWPPRVGAPGEAPPRGGGGEPEDGEREETLRDSQLDGMALDDDVADTLVDEADEAFVMDTMVDLPYREVDPAFDEAFADTLVDVDVAGQGAAPSSAAPVASQQRGPEVVPEEHGATLVDVPVSGGRQRPPTPPSAAAIASAVAPETAVVGTPVVEDVAAVLAEEQPEPAPAPPAGNMGTAPAPSEPSSTGGTAAQAPPSPPGPPEPSSQLPELASSSSSSDLEVEAEEEASAPAPAAAPPVPSTVAATPPPSRGAAAAAEGGDSLHAAAAIGSAGASAGSSGGGCSQTIDCRGGGGAGAAAGAPTGVSFVRQPTPAVLPETVAGAVESAAGPHAQVSAEATAGADSLPPGGASAQEDRPDGAPATGEGLAEAAAVAGTVPAAPEQPRERGAGLAESMASLVATLPARPSCTLPCAPSELPTPASTLLGQWVRDGGRTHKVVWTPGPAGSFLEFRPADGSKRAIPIVLEGSTWVLNGFCLDVARSSAELLRWENPTTGAERSWRRPEAGGDGNGGVAAGAAVAALAGSFAGEASR